jgi:small subunit ribosomal protein S13
MARIAGVDLSPNRKKRIEVALTYIYGIGPARAKRVLETTGVNPDTRVLNLTEDELTKLSRAVTALRVEGDLRREVAGHIKRLMDIGCYRGLRHRRGLPARGQRTRTNARTRKGPKKTIGAKRKAKK